MAQEPLERGERDALLNGRDREGMAQDVGSDRPADVGPVRHALDEPLDGARTHAELFMYGKVALDEGADPWGRVGSPGV